MNKRNVLIMAIAALMCAGMATADYIQESTGMIIQQYCINATHELATNEYNITTNGTDVQYQYNQTVPCLNGCSNTLGKCRPNAYELHISSFALIIVIMAIGVLGIRYGGYYTPVVLMLVLTLVIAVYSTDVFIGGDKLIILIVSLALVGMNADEFLKYMDWKKYRSDDE